MCERVNKYRCYIFQKKQQENTMLQNTLTSTCILLVPPLTAVSPAVAMAVTTPHAAQVQVSGGSKTSVYGCLGCCRAACGQNKAANCLSSWDRQATSNHPMACRDFQWLTMRGCLRGVPGPFAGDSAVTAGISCSGVPRVSGNACKQVHYCILRECTNKPT